MEGKLFSSTDMRKVCELDMQYQGLWEKASRIENDYESMNRIIFMGKSYTQVLDVCERTRNCLGEILLEKLVQKQEKELKKTRWFGEKCLLELKDQLDLLGLRLGMTQEDIEAYLVGEYANLMRT